MISLASCITVYNREAIATIEQWKDISEYGGVYQISNFGRVRSFNTYNRVDKSPRYMRPFNNGSGYYVVSLRKTGKRKNHYIHRLVAEAFLQRIGNNDVVNHRDFDKSNNHVSNLEWCTQRENVNYSNLRMEKPHNCKLPKVTGEKYIKFRNCDRYEVTVRKKYIGSYTSLEEAKAARDKAIKVLWAGVIC